jgi:hypothetical protein
MGDKDATQAKIKNEVDMTMNVMLDNIDAMEAKFSDFEQKLNQENIYRKHWLKFFMTFFGLDDVDCVDTWKKVGLGFGMITLGALITFVFVGIPWLIIRQMVINGTLSCYDNQVSGPVATKYCSPDYGGGGNLSDSTREHAKGIILPLVGFYTCCMLCFVAFACGCDRIRRKKKELTKQMNNMEENAESDLIEK